MNFNKSFCKIYRIGADVLYCPMIPFSASNSAWYLPGSVMALAAIVTRTDDRQRGGKGI